MRRRLYTSLGKVARIAVHRPKLAVQFTSQFLEGRNRRRARMFSAYVSRHASVDLPLVAHLLGDKPGMSGGMGIVRDEDRKIWNIDQTEPLRPFEQLGRVAAADNHNFGRPALIKVNRFEHVREAERLLFDKFAKQLERPLRLGAVALHAGVA